MLPETLSPVLLTGFEVLFRLRFVEMRADEGEQAAREAAHLAEACAPGGWQLKVRNGD